MFTPDATDRRCLLLVVMAREPSRTFTVAELAEMLGDLTRDVGRRRPGQLVSDALRTPVVRGWVVREGRGRYRHGTVSPTNLRRARRRVAALRSGLDPFERSAHSNWRSTTEYGQPVPPVDDVGRPAA